MMKKPPSTSFISKIKIIVPAIIFLMLALYLGTQLGKRAQNGPPPITIDKSVEIRPALWQVNGVNGTAYLFGTVHILPENVKWQTPQISKAIKTSDALIVEVTGLEDNQKVGDVFSKLATSPNLPPLKERLPATLHASFDKIIKDNRIEEENLNKLENWAAALTLTSAISQSLQLERSEGVERILSEQFTALGKPIKPLETVEQQFTIFDTLSDADQRAILENIVSEADASAENFSSLLNAWVSGNEAELEKAASKAMKQAPELRTALLVNRNKDWAIQIAEQLEKKQTLFIAVGAAHLVGSDSVQELLKTAGYSVKRL